MHAAADLPLDLAALRTARERVAGLVLTTPLWANDPLSRELGGSIYLKLENLQRTGSFKLRGAAHKLACLLSRGEGGRGVVAASAGNHAQGVARAARESGIAATVVMPVNAPLTKIESCRNLGARVVLQGSTLEEARQAAEGIAAGSGASVIDPYDDWEIIAGQAGVGLEIIEALPDAAQIVVPLGGGGLLAGIALAVKSQRPDVRIVGVQADADQQDERQRRLEDDQPFLRHRGTVASRPVNTAQGLRRIRMRRDPSRYRAEDYARHQ